MINSDTLIYGSFGKTAGNLGCHFFNGAFKKYNINAIYKSFSVSNIKDAFYAAKTLNFSGFAIAAPFKKQICKVIENYLPFNFDTSHLTMKNQLIANTVLLTRTGHAIPFNTDYTACITLAKSIDYTTPICIAGDGGLGCTMWEALRIYTDDLTILNKSELYKLKNQEDSTIINCTPSDLVVHPSSTILDCRTTHSFGKIFYEIQSRKQFELYTNIVYQDGPDCSTMFS